jgi:hypothetical protein
MFRERITDVLVLGCRVKGLGFRSAFRYPGIRV